MSLDLLLSATQNIPWKECVWQETIFYQNCDEATELRM